MKKILALSLFLAIAVFAVSCGSKKDAGDEIIIGSLQDITGPTSSLGKMVHEGALLAIEEINAKGGISGKKIKLVSYDTKGDVNEAINAFTRAVTTGKASAIIGPPVANIAMAIAPISERYDVPVLGLAIDPKCHIKEDGSPYKNMFGMQPNALQQGRIMASYAMKNGFKRYGIIYNEANAYATSLLPSFIETINKGSGKILAQVPYNPNDRDFKTLLNKIISQNVDAIYAPGYTQDLILIAQQARAIGFKGALIFGLDACPPFNTLMGEPCDNIYYINNVDDTEPQLQAMIKSVKEKKNIDVTNKFFLGYDTANIIAQLISENGTDPKALSAAVEKVTNYKGLTGIITIDPKTHMP
ncbi:MAG: ABC transporter substrate-binding protein, partial [Elusimicrobiota bacterium]|nr:ABC transporter substrate-binding protein [Elusimicrobiota bacterium]